jgi:hypothetical protein
MMIEGAMNQASLSTFNPRNTGLYEALVWKAYYDRRWQLALLLLFRMLRSQFSLTPMQALWAASWATVAGLVLEAATPR